MATFLNKKEQVINLKLTNYGHYLFSIGAFSPAYYAFFDDNIIYDGAYVGISESQNRIVKRIKEETQYVESLVLFEDAEKEVTKAPSELVNFFEVDITPTRKIPRKDTFKYDRAIGDAYLDGQNADAAPAWKLVLLNGEITKVSERDEPNNLNIPQIDIMSTYTPRVVSSEVALRPKSVLDVIDRTPIFSDGNQVILEAENIMVYVDEVNTEFLSNNFDIEVFQYITGSVTGNVERKFFETKIDQIVDGKMLMPNPRQKEISSLPSSSVEYYVDLLTDQKVDQTMACRGAEMFNRNSYYVDLGFECRNVVDDLYFDIYGSEVEPEICAD
jgi:hypothetical protein